MNTIEIWKPRYHDMTVLIAPYRVKDGVNRIIFTKTYPNKELFMDGAKIRTYPKQPNGKISCYAVPFIDFEVFEREDKQLTMEMNDGTH